MHPAARHAVMLLARYGSPFQPVAGADVEQQAHRYIHRAIPAWHGHRIDCFHSLAGCSCLGFKPRLGSHCVLRIEVRQVGDEILDHGPCEQRIDFNRAFTSSRHRYRQRIDPSMSLRKDRNTLFRGRTGKVSVRVISFFDLIQRVSRIIGPAGIHIDENTLFDRRVFPVIGVPAIHLKLRRFLAPSVFRAMSYPVVITGVLGSVVEHIASPGLSQMPSSLQFSGAYVFSDVKRISFAK